VPDLQKVLGVGVHIVYKTGGSGAVGFLALHQAKPDGYTISNVVTPNIVVTSLGKDVGYQAGDFSYVAMTEASPGALAVATGSKFKTLKDFVEYAKAHPGKLTIAGTGETGQAGTAEILAACGITANYVPVSGGVGAIIPDVAGGHVDAAFMPASDVLLHKDSIRALGIAGSAPSPTLPDVPTFEAAGYSGFTIGQAWGVMAPPNTPDEIVQALNAAVEQAVQDPKVQDALKADGLTPLTQTPAQAKQYILDTVQSVKKDQQLVAQMGK
jgi:tripartite-type tricarboxylate transporter receptor subunit TctC